MIADQKSTQPRRRQGGLHAFRSILLFVLAPLALAPSPASAALLEVDLNGTPQVNGLANLDTRTGLIWLDDPSSRTSITTPPRVIRASGTRPRARSRHS
jgi:hypothetical protein